MQVWERVAALLPERAASIDTLQAKLTQGEQQHGQLVRGMLRRLVAKLNEIAHVSEGEAERIIEAEALDCNHKALADEASFAALVTKLRIAEVQLEKSKREEYERAVAAWRVLRTRHAMQHFVERLRSDEFAQPPERAAVFEELRAAQAQHFKRVSEQTLLLAGAAPATLDAKMSARCVLACGRLVLSLRAALFCFKRLDTEHGPYTGSKRRSRPPATLGTRSARRIGRG